MFVQATHLPTQKWVRQATRRSSSAYYPVFVPRKTLLLPRTMWWTLYKTRCRFFSNAWHEQKTLLARKDAFCGQMTSTWIFVSPDILVRPMSQVFFVSFSFLFLGNTLLNRLSVIPIYRETVHCLAWKIFAVFRKTLLFQHFHENHANQKKLFYLSSSHLQMRNICRYFQFNRLLFQAE